MKRLYTFLFSAVLCLGLLFSATGCYLYASPYDDDPYYYDGNYYHYDISVGRWYYFHGGRRIYRVIPHRAPPPYHYFHRPPVRRWHG